MSMHEIRYVELLLVMETWLLYSGGTTTSVQSQPEQQNKGQNENKLTHRAFLGQRLYYQVTVMTLAGWHVDALPRHP